MLTTIGYPIAVGAGLVFVIFFVYVLARVGTLGIMRSISDWRTKQLERRE